MLDGAGVRLVAKKNTVLPIRGVSLLMRAVIRQRPPAIAVAAFTLVTALPRSFALDAGACLPSTKGRAIDEELDCSA
jgi:hypothetical protein